MLADASTAFVGAENTATCSLRAAGAGAETAGGMAGVAASCLASCGAAAETSAADADPSLAGAGLGALISSFGCGARTAFALLPSSGAGRC